jgi:hypothetical protein
MRASDSPYEREEKRVKSIRGMSNRESQDEYHLCVCRDPARSSEAEESFKDSKRTKLRRAVLSHTCP